MASLKIKKNKGTSHQTVQIEKVEQLYLFEKIPIKAVIIALLILLTILLVLWYASTRPAKIKEKPQEETPTTERQVFTGPRGGQYYFSRGGNKVYVTPPPEKIE